MLVVDFMHECELGTWKALFTHLIHLLHTIPGGDHLVTTLDNRLNCIPSYGNGVICKFANNTSKMKRLAAQDFEDILQCAMPVFKGLFPADHDEIIQLLLYRFAQWHALTKLRMHSESTLSVLDKTFKCLTHQLHKFQKFTCNTFTTMELPKERAAHKHKATHQCLTSDIPDAGGGGQRTKKFNMNTYKFHTIGDYLQTIQLFGMIDSFTSQIVCEHPFHIFHLNLILGQGELVHRALNTFYPLTSKLDTPAQLAKHEHCCCIL
ncbi:hypothetical protein BDR06DRAFT_1039209 [Suillus hirtellus]|nr:hypothetical protein BDR06DRAFT_1039209 [Suillus hirtellus]